MTMEAMRTVESSLVMSRMLPIPRARDLSRKILICHFMIKAPKVKPVINRKIEKGVALRISLNSGFFKAGFRK